MAASQLPVMPTLQQLLSGVALPDSLATALVGGLCLDSRLVKPGDVFVAVPGLDHDGRDYISQALKAGAVAVLAEKNDFGSKVFSSSDSRVVLITGLNQQLSEIAGRFYSDPSDQLILTGITGTNGKTTCSLLLAQLFSLIKESKDCPVGVIGTLGCGAVVNGRPDFQETGMTTPDAITTQSILSDYVAQNVERVVMEVSSHSLVQYRVQALAFNTAVFTNLSRDHLDYHGDLVSYASAKMQLFTMPGLEHAVINMDDPVGAEMAAEIASQLFPAIEVIGYSLTNPNTSVYVERIVLSPQGITAYVYTPWGEGELNSQLVGRFNLQNLLAVISIACLQGMSFCSVLAVLPQLKPVSGRMELISVEGSEESIDKKGAPQIVVDYAHTPDALKNTLEILREHCGGKLWCVFGCGGDRDQGKRPLMGEVASKLADHVVVTSDNPRSEDPESIIKDICDGLIDDGLVNGLSESCQVDVILDREQAIHLAIQSASQGDVVLIAGKGHESYQLVGVRRLPFSDQAQARLALRQRGGRDDG